MSGPIVRTGTTPEFWKNWDQVFGETSGAKKKTTKKKAAKKKATKKKAAKKKAAKKKSKK
ncbi:MAG: RNA polymerase subunit sigma [Planctomycetaceae bacterium]|nr:RNA polymerase subunit sigma [Planctomycetaceae bacterium]